MALRGIYRNLVIIPATTITLTPGVTKTSRTGYATSFEVARDQLVRLNRAVSGTAFSTDGPSFVSMESASLRVYTSAGSNDLASLPGIFGAVTALLDGISVAFAPYEVRSNDAIDVLLDSGNYLLGLTVTANNSDTANHSLLIPFFSCDFEVNQYDNPRLE